MIMFKDLADVKSQVDFKDLMETLNSQEDQLSTQKKGNMNGDDSSLDLLLVFNNSDDIPQQYWKSLELRLASLYSENKGVRIVFGYTKKPPLISAFKWEQRSQPQNSKDQDTEFVDEHQVIVLKKLNKVESVDLLITMCEREITSGDFKTEIQHGIHSQLETNP